MSSIVATPRLVDASTQTEIISIGNDDIITPEIEEKLSEWAEMKEQKNKAEKRKADNEKAQKAREIRDAADRAVNEKYKEWKGEHYAMELSFEPDLESRAEVSNALQVIPSTSC